MSLNDHKSFRRLTGYFLRFGLAVVHYGVSSDSEIFEDKDNYLYFHTALVAGMITFEFIIAFSFTYDEHHDPRHTGSDHDKGINMNALHNVEADNAKH